MSRFQAHAILLIVLCSLALGFTWSVAPSEKNRVTTDFARIPLEFGHWVIYDDTGFDEETKRLLPSSSLMYRWYEHDEADVKVGLAIVYGVDLGNFHQPEICLEGQGWRGQTRRMVKIRDEESGKTFDAMSMVMEHSAQGRMAWLYWFMSEGATSTSLGNYKTRVMVNRLMLKQVRPSAMIRISAPVTSTDEESESYLVDFAQSVLPYLKKEFYAGAASE